MKTHVMMLAGVTGLALSSGAFAQTWDGGAPFDSLWSDGANWNPNVAPANNGTAAILMTGNTRTSNDVSPSYSIASLTFGPGASTFHLNSVSNSTLTIGAGGLSHQTNLVFHAIEVPVIIAAAQTWTTLGPLNVLDPVTVNAPLNLSPQVAGTGSTITFSAAVGGAGPITKSGAGRVSISAPMTATGGMNITAGEVLLLTSNALPNGLINVTGGLLDMNNQVAGIADLAGGAGGSINVRGGLLSTTVSTNRVLDAAVIGTSSAVLVKSGTADLVISNFNNFLGTITINSGAVITSGNQVIADTARISTSYGHLVVNGTETVGPVLLLASSSLSGSGSLTAPSIDLGGTGTATISVPTSGPGQLTKADPLRLILSAAANHANGVLVSGGTLEQTETGSIQGLLVVSSGAVYTVVGNPTISSINSSGSVGVLNNLSSLSLGSGSLGGTVSGAGKLIKTGPGALDLVATNINLSQGFEIAGGLVTQSLPAVLNDVLGLKVSGGLYDLDALETIGTLTMVNGQIAGTGQLTLLNAGDFQGGTITLPLACPSTAAVSKQGTGTLTLSGDNSGMLRGITINAGVLEVSRDANLGAPGTSTVLQGGTLRFLAPAIISRSIAIGVPGGTIDCTSDITVSQLGQSSGTLTKAGDGTLTLSNGAPACTAITVSRGELMFPAQTSALLSGPLTLTSTGLCTLNGGSISANTISNGGDILLEDDARLSASTMTNSGVLEGDGRLTCALTNTSSGEVWVHENERIWVNSTQTSTNAGTVEVLGGEFIADGPMTNAASTGFIYGGDAILRFRGGLSNSGSMLVTLGDAWIFGDIANTASGLIVASGGQSATFFDDVVNNGQIRTSAGSLCVFAGAISGSGSFPGTGSVYFEGDLRPGNSPANVSFGGNVYLTSTCATHVEVGGLAAGSQHDKLTVAGAITLDGALHVDLINGFLPHGGDAITIIQAGQVSGHFSDISLPRGMHLSYESTRVRLIACPGDFNEDGIVDFFDYLDFLNAFSTGSDEADFNGDQVIDFFDYLDFLEAFNSPC